MGTPTRRLGLHHLEINSNIRMYVLRKLSLAGFTGRKTGRSHASATINSLESKKVQIYCDPVSTPEEPDFKSAGWRRSGPKWRDRPPCGKRSSCSQGRGLIPPLQPLVVDCLSALSSDPAYLGTRRPGLDQREPFTTSTDRRRWEGSRLQTRNRHRAEATADRHARFTPRTRRDRSGVTASMAGAPRRILPP